MDFRFEHRIEQPVERVAAGLLSADFVPRLVAAARPLADGRLLRLDDRGDLVEREAWFRAAPAWLGAPFGRVGAVAWRETVKWQRAQRRGSFRVEPDARAVIRRRVRCEGEYRLAPDGPARTLRVIEGLVEIRAPVVGRAAEARIVELLTGLFDDEAALLSAGAA